MKRLFDPSDPAISRALGVLRARARLAREACERLADAVRPIFSLDRSGKAFSQSGSGVLVTIGGDLFLFSASHVFDAIGDHEVAIGADSSLHFLSGERFSSARGKSGTHADDSVDASVLHVQCKVPTALVKAALPVDTLDAGPAPSVRQIHVAMGYRAAKSRRLNRLLMSQLERYPTFEYEDAEYDALGICRSTMAALTFEEQVLVGDELRTSPSPKGMSGGAIVMVEGLPADPSRPVAGAATPLLTAIISDLRKAKGRAPRALIGPRISYHLGLISRPDPNCPRSL